MVGVGGCRKIVPGCQQERTRAVALIVNVYRTQRQMSYLENILVLWKLS